MASSCQPPYPPHSPYDTPNPHSQDESDRSNAWQVFFQHMHRLIPSFLLFGVIVEYYVLFYCFSLVPFLLYPPGPSFPPSLFPSLLPFLLPSFSSLPTMQTCSLFLSPSPALLRLSSSPSDRPYQRSSYVTPTIRPPPSSPSRGKGQKGRTVKNTLRPTHISTPPPPIDSHSGP